MTEYTGRHYVAVTKSDTTNLTRKDETPIGFYIGVSGDVVLKSAPGETAVTFKSVPVGFMPVSATHVMAATAATDIVAIYERL